MPRWSVQTITLIFWLLCPVLAAFLTWHFSHNARLAGSASLALIFGQLVGFSEIIARYRDEPLRATFNRLGITYLLINGAISESAFFVLWVFSPKLLPAL